mgnify:FL=1
MAAYQSETQQYCIGGHTFTVVGFTPSPRPDEEVAVRKDIEQQLYDVFVKYMPASA